MSASSGDNGPSFVAWLGKDRGSIMPNATSTSKTLEPLDGSLRNPIDLQRLVPIPDVGGKPIPKTYSVIPDTSWALTDLRGLCGFGWTRFRALFFANCTQRQDINCKKGRSHKVVIEIRPRSERSPSKFTVRYQDILHAGKVKYSHGTKGSSWIN